MHLQNNQSKACFVASIFFSLLAALPVVGYAQEAGSMAASQVSSVLERFQCEKKGAGLNGGAGELCLGGLINAVVVAQQKVILNDASQTNVAAAYKKVKSMFPNAILQNNTTIVIPLD